MRYYIYNKQANNGIGETFKGSENGKVVFADEIDYGNFFTNLEKDDEAVLIGGDGTLNYFVNHVDCDKLKNNIYLLSGGTGNDFLCDIGADGSKEVLINDYVKNLPTVYVNGIERKFINGVGFGIDGYCCETADEIKEKNPQTEINYSSIAIKGMLFHFGKRKAKIKVDGKEYEYNNVWLSPTMKGRYYGGGMKIAPSQDRKDTGLTNVVYCAKTRLGALISFPSIFDGSHVNKKKTAFFHTGSEIEVTFSKPCALQIDGETVKNVTSYKVKA